ncbi:hypothetical protein CYLTODRAFT_334068, partial [Cylindrobasidium torrendii FP15055 ss-10]
GQYYDVTGRGINNQGNTWSSRQNTSGQHGYHYANKDGGYYYQNFDDSRYYQSPGNYAEYTRPSG